MLLLMALLAFAEPLGVQGKLSLTVTPWRANCSVLKEGAPGECAVPQPIPGMGPLQDQLELKSAHQPGQGAAVSKDYRFFDPATQKEFLARLKVFSIFPQVGSEFPPYIQIRLELVSPVRAICIQSVEWAQMPKPAQKLPPLICAGFESPGDQKESLQWGITLVPKRDASAP